MKTWVIILIVVVSVSIILLFLILFFAIIFLSPIFLVSQTYNDYNETFNETDWSRTYEDFTYNVSIKCFKEWSMIPKHKVYQLSDNQLVLCMKGLEGATIYLGAMKYNGTKEDYTNELLNRMKSKNLTIHDNNETILGDLPAHGLIAGDTNSTTMFVYTKKQDTLYFIMYLGIGDSYGMNQGQAKAIINTFKFTK
jgi:hypothetical protein